MSPNLAAAVDELGQLGVRVASTFERDSAGNPGIVILERGGRAGEIRTFTVAPAVLENQDQALDWARIVATLALDVRA
jgi:hypothetical protein